MSRGSGGAQRCVRGRCFGHRRSRTRRRFGRIWHCHCHEGCRSLVWVSSSALNGLAVWEALNGQHLTHAGHIWLKEKASSTSSNRSNSSNSSDSNSSNSSDSSNSSNSSNSSSSTSSSSSSSSTNDKLWAAAAAAAAAAATDSSCRHGARGGGPTQQRWQRQWRWQRQRVGENKKREGEGGKTKKR